MATRYEGSPVTVTIGQSQVVSLPPRVFRGRATCMHFDTDKAFLLPPSVPGVRNIVSFFAKHPGAKMLVNGHTDLVGDAQSNLTLSNERAAAVAAYLLGNSDDWLAWYQAPDAAKRWSYLEDQYMLATVTDSTSAPYYSGAPSGVNDAPTQAATKRFQSDNGLSADAQLGPDTRRVLITKYMALEGTSLPAGTPLVKHGCGQFHPVDASSGDDAGNRRVEVFLFEGAVDPPPEEPCPSPAGCQQYRQWVGNPAEDIDLCQAQPETVDVRIRLFDPWSNPLPNAPYHILSGQSPERGVADSHGFVTLTAVSAPATITIRWSVPDDLKIQRGGRASGNPDKLDMEKDVFIDIDSRPESDRVRMQLDNLGYVLGPTINDDVLAFERDYDLAATGDPNDPLMQAALKERHDAHDPKPREVPAPETRLGEGDF